MKERNQRKWKLFKKSKNAKIYQHSQGCTLYFTKVRGISAKLGGKA
jgi:hypothetical protein